MTAERLSFLHRNVPAAFEVAFVALEPGARRPYDEAEWLGALVVVEEGRLELECRRGARRAFEAGAVLWLTGLPLKALHNPGPAPALLAAVTRRCHRTDEFAIGPRLYMCNPEPTTPEPTS